MRFFIVAMALLYFAVDVAGKSYHVGKDDCDVSVADAALNRDVIADDLNVWRISSYRRPIFDSNVEELASDPMENVFVRYRLDPESGTADFGMSVPLKCN